MRWLRWQCFLCLAMTFQHCCLETATAWQASAVKKNFRHQQGPLQNRVTPHDNNNNEDSANDGSSPNMNKNTDQELPFVSRLAVRPFHPTDSKPSSPRYTTRKEERHRVSVSAEGQFDQDYNHYRSVALQNTPNRAVSILTADVLDYLRSREEEGGYPVQDGDLGENIMIQNIAFDEIQVSNIFKFVPSSSSSSPSTSSIVEIEITEPIVACANLCQLSYINDKSLTPRQRIDKCQEFLTILDQKPGLRGWYAKVLKGGDICAGDAFVRLQNSKQQEQQQEPE